MRRVTPYALLKFVALVTLPGLSVGCSSVHTTALQKLPDRRVD
jgi:hypothetical protein